MLRISATPSQGSSRIAKLVTRLGVGGGSPFIVDLNRPQDQIRSQACGGVIIIAALPRIAFATQPNQDQIKRRRSCGKSGSYEDWTVDDLRKRVKELGLSGYSGKHKSELVSMLRNH